MRNNRTDIVIFHYRDQVQRRVLQPGQYQWSNGQNQGNGSVSNFLKGPTVWVPGKGNGRIILGEKLKLTNIKLCWQTNLKLESNLGGKAASLRWREVYKWKYKQWTMKRINMMFKMLLRTKRIGQLFNLVEKAITDWRGQICILKKGSLTKKVGKESRHKNENNERRKRWQLLEMVERADKDWRGKLAPTAHLFSATLGV